MDKVELLATQSSEGDAYEIFVTLPFWDLKGPYVQSLGLTLDEAHALATDLLTLISDAESHGPSDE